MWVTREDFIRLNVHYAEAIVKTVVIERTNAAQQVTLDWLMLRVTQLEKERAAMLMAVTHGEVRIETPVITREPAAAIPQNTSLDAMDIFADMGEEKAQQLGIGWNEDGTLKRL